MNKYVNVWINILKSRNIVQKKNFLRWLFKNDIKIFWNQEVIVRKMLSNVLYVTYTYIRCLG